MAETSVTTSAPQLVAEKKGMIGRFNGFIAEVQREMKKVSWPKREELQDATVVTLVLTLVLSAFIFGVDKIFEVVLRLVYGM
jgi:preprotein translocase subunit SecE